MLIDLSLDCTTTLPPERVAPANRIRIAGIDECDYLMYPLADQLADKLCGIMELQPGGYPSSRMKDLADVVLYATHETFSQGELRLAIESECLKRGMDVPERFAAPEFWGDRFASFAKDKLPRELSSFDAACNVAARFFDVAVAPGDGDMSWDPGACAWKAGDEQHLRRSS